MGYGDPIRTDEYTREQLASLIEGCLVLDFARDVDSSNISTTSTSMVTANVSVTVTVATGQVVLVGFNIGISGDSTPGTAYAAIFENGSTVNFDSAIGLDADSTSGAQNAISQTQLITSPATGSVTYDLRYSRSSGLNTVYSSYQQIWAMVLEAA